MGRVLARVAALIALAWCLGLVWFAGTLPGPAPDGARTDGIVVLTGGEGRIERGLKLLRAGAAQRLLISGVGAYTTPAEIAGPAHAPRALMACCVDLGREAVDTRSNAEETAAWVRANRMRSLRLVTSDYHLRRARVELAAEIGPGVTILSDAVPAHVSGAVLAREYMKWAWRAGVRLAEGR